MEGENKYLEELVTKNIDDPVIHMRWFMEARERSALVLKCPECQQTGNRRYKGSFSPLCCISGHVWWSGSGEMYLEQEPTCNWKKCLDQKGMDHYNLLWRRQLAKNITKAAETLEILSQEKRSMRKRL